MGRLLELGAAMSWLANRAVGGVVSSLVGGTTVGTAMDLGVVVRREGTIGVYTNGSPSTTFPTRPWHRSFMTSIGDVFWVRFTLVSGDVPVGTTGAWLQLNVDRAIYYQSIFGLRSGTFTVEIASSSGGTPIVSASASGAYLVTKNP